MALQDRVTKILMDPKAEWPVIEREPTDVARLYREYIAILAAIPVVCSFIGMTLIGITVPFIGTYRVPVLTALANAVVSYVLGLVGVYVASLIIDKLAPTFESKSDPIQALKLVAYASTPVWIAGVLNLIPALGVLSILAALYAIYLCYIGLPILMKTPPAKVVPYMAVSAVVIIAITFAMGLVAAALVGISAPTAF